MEKKPGLRERKFARTRLKLVQALVARLEQASLDDIVVRDLCDDVEISEATFFNYFAKKVDLLDHYTQLWMLDMTWRCLNVNARGLAAVTVSFDFMATTIHKQPGVMAEMVARQVLQRAKPEPMEITLAERMIAYPEYAGIETLQVGGVDKAWLPALESAVRGGELPANTHMPTVIVGLASIFYGVPMVLRQGNPNAISGMYRSQLAIYWAGVKQSAGRT